MSSSPFARILVTALLATALVSLSAQTPAEGPRGAARFYADDPLWRDDDMRSIPLPAEHDLSKSYEFVANTFGDTARSFGPALNVNTLGEVPDSSWFTNRIGQHDLTIDDVLRGPDDRDGPAPGIWQVTGRPDAGITPKFTIRDARGDTYLIKLDPPSNPELPSSVELISTKLFHAIGYHVPQDFIVAFTVDRLTRGARRHDPECEWRSRAHPARRRRSLAASHAAARRWVDSRAGEPVCARNGRRAIHVYRQALGRSERSVSARAAAGTARDAAVRGLAESRRRPGDQQHRYLRRGSRPSLHPPLHAGLRLQSGQRQHVGAAAARGLRISDRTGQSREGAGLHSACISATG